eukprot:260569-Rhodomonas_salina.3
MITGTGSENLTDSQCHSVTAAVPGPVPGPPAVARGLQLARVVASKPEPAEPGMSLWICTEARVPVRD